MFTGRAASQEFGETVSEGIYALLHLNVMVSHATLDYWVQFLDSRSAYLDALIGRLHNMRDLSRNVFLAINTAKASLMRIEPALCEEYVNAWREDLMSWDERIRRIPRAREGSAEEVSSLLDLHFHKSRE
jgi:hypothetical protein